MDQSLFAAPHGFSQRITSFIACACQGIHQMPLRHLIVLIANAHHLVVVSSETIDGPGYLLQPNLLNNAINVFDKSALLELRRAAHLQPVFKTSFSRLNPVPRGQATVIRSFIRDGQSHQQRTIQSDKLPTYLQSFPKVRPARPSQGSSGQGSDMGQTHTWKPPDQSSLHNVCRTGSTLAGDANFYFFKRQWSNHRRHRQAAAKGCACPTTTKNGGA